MACGSCGQRANAATKYPYEAVMRDGTKVTVHSAQEERAERAKADARIRTTSRTKGYSVS